MEKNLAPFASTSSHLAIIFTYIFVHLQYCNSSIITSVIVFRKYSVDFWNILWHSSNTEFLGTHRPDRNYFWIYGCSRTCRVSCMIPWSIKGSIGSKKPVTKSFRPMDMKSTGEVYRRTLGRNIQDFRATLWKWNSQECSSFSVIKCISWCRSEL